MTSLSNPQTAAKATRTPINPWFVFVLICVPILIGSIDLTAIVVVLPQATLDLLGPQGLSRADQALWAVTAYLLAYTISLALVGRLSDVLPRKSVFIACIVVFIFGALWAGLATEFPLQILASLPIWPDRDMLPLISLVIGRVIQAIGAGASVSVGMALISDIFPPEKRAEPISLIGAVDSLGWVIGNLYAGLMLQILPSWRWLFLINAGVAIVALVLTVLALRAARTVPVGGRFDWRGGILFAAALSALTIGVEALNKPGSEGLILLITSAALLIVFIWLQMRTRNALFDMQFIRQREVRAALVTNLIVGLGLILIVAGVPLVINLRAVFLRGEGLLTGALRAGIMLCALTVPLIVAVLVGESRYRRVGAGVPVALGLFLALIGFVGTIFWTYTAPSYVIALPLALVGVGLGLTIGPLSLVVIDAAQESARGLASSLVLVMRLLGMTVGTPLAASLTLNLANEWASQQADRMTEQLRSLARPMLIPPLAIDALARVMIIGAAGCIVGLVIFYGPRALRAIRAQRLGTRALLAGSPALVVIVLLTVAASIVDSYTTPAVLPNPIARQLPPNVEFYAGLNIQRAFLLNSRRPLDAVFDIVNFINAQQQAAYQAQLEQQQQEQQEQQGSGGENQIPPEQGTQPPQQTPPPEQQPPEEYDTAMKTVIRALFLPTSWRNDNYLPFCPYSVSPDQYELCFTNGLLSWIGPQAAFAVLPRTRTDYDYLFVFQATNRNNAIQFATNLATSLGEAPPVEVGPNLRVMTINGGKPQVRQVAITQAYVVIGTPKAVEYMLNHGNISLADQPDYQHVTAQLPPEDFLTIYFRSANIEADLRPALSAFFQDALIDGALRALRQISPLALTRTSAAPTILGISARVNEAQLVLNSVASSPFSLQKLNAVAVPSTLLARIPPDSDGWVAANLNIAGLARDIDLLGSLKSVAAESGDVTIQALLNNPLVQGPVAAFVQTLQRLLTYARGEFLLVNAGQSAALVLPLIDKAAPAAETLRLVRSQLELFGTLTRAWSVQSATVDGYPDEIVSISMSGGDPQSTGLLHYSLSADNVLIVALGSESRALIPTLWQGGQDNAQAQIAASRLGSDDKFVYAYVAPSIMRDGSSFVLAGQLRDQTLYLDVVLQTK